MFKPGDRVQYNSDGDCEEYRGSFGTITADLKDGIVDVRWDGDKFVTRHMASCLQRQPIEPGCHVVGLDLASGPDRSVFYVYDPRTHAQIDKLQAALTSVVKIIRERRPEIAVFEQLDAWLAEYDPQQPPVFERGDLVTWSAGQVHGRIVKMPVQINDPYEVIITAVQNGNRLQLGKFLNISNGQNIRHSPLK